MITLSSLLFFSFYCQFLYYFYGTGGLEDYFSGEEDSSSITHLNLPFDCYYGIELDEDFESY